MLTCKGRSPVYHVTKIHQGDETNFPWNKETFGHICSASLARAGDLNAQTFIMTIILSCLPFERRYLTINYFENYLSTFPFYVGYCSSYFTLMKIVNGFKFLKYFKNSFIFFIIHALQWFKCLYPLRCCLGDYINPKWSRSSLSSCCQCVTLIGVANRGESTSCSFIKY